MRATVLLLLMTACENPGTESKDPPITAEPPDTDTPTDSGDDTDTEPVTDADGDSFDVTEDCDDADAAVFPGAEEVCYDGVDQNCDAASDFDCDADGADAADHGGTDCDDADAAVLPGAVEAQDGVDQDCDGWVDEDFVSSGDLVVTELMVLPTPGATGEWFEVANLSDHDVDLVGWTLWADDGERFVIPDSLVVAAGDRVVLGASTDRTINGGAAVDLAWVGFSLSDAVDSVYLELDGVVMAGVAYGDGWTFTSGVSIGLDPLSTDPVSAADPASWCSGPSRFGDGDYGTPGLPNDACTNVDHDGDGYSVDEGDCDDTESLAFPGAIEAWDGADNDCDGTVDHLTTDAAIGWIDGEGSDDLGYEGALGTGDTDGDGELDVVVGGRHLESSSTGGLYLVHAADLLTTGDAEDLAYAIVLGDDVYNYAGAVSPTLGDSDGDGLDDVVVGASDYYVDTYPTNTGGGFLSGAALSGLTTVGAGSTVLVGTGFTQTFVVSNLDIDGDGLSDAVYGDPYADSTLTSQGAAYVLTAATLTGGGAIELNDADQVILGEDDYDYLGFSVSGGDLDGDGYDEVMLGSFGSDLGVEEGGALYIVSGGPALVSGSVADVDRAVIAGYANDSHLGINTPALVHDLDADGDADLAVTARLDGKAWVFLNAGALSGQVSAVDASCELDGGAEDNFGTGLTAGDFDGDGVPELVIGAADTYNTDLPPDQSGMVYGWSGDRLSSATLDALDADFSLTGGVDMFGFILHAADVQGDGDDELFVAAPMYSATRDGRLYLFDR